MDIEFIIKDKRRLAVINDLSVEEPITLHRLAAKNRIPEVMMGRVLQSMEEKGIIKLIEKEYWLTDSGREMIKDLRKLEKVPSPYTSGLREGAQVRIAPDHKRNQIDRRRVP
jgi:DNA-binding HxlR family transcriptional regulator